MRFRAEVVVSASADRVFASYVDPHLRREWIEGLDEVIVVRSPADEPGGVVEMRLRASGQVIALTQRVLAVRPGVSYDFLAGNAWADASVRVRFEPVERGTRLVCDNQVRGRGHPWTRILPLLERTIRERVEQDLARFKALVEAEYAATG